MSELIIEQFPPTPDNMGPKPADTLGDEVKQDWIDMGVWRYVLDEHGQKTGYVKRERMKTVAEVFEDLYAAMDFHICDACGQERPKPKTKRPVYSERHKDCTAATVGEWQSAIDEYFHGPTLPCESFVIPHDFTRVCCFPVTGGSEGHYWHVGILCPCGVVPAKEYSPRPAEHVSAFRRIALGKTFMGWDHCVKMAARCAKLLGA